MTFFIDFGRFHTRIYLFFRLDFDILKKHILLLVKKQVL